MSEDEEDRKNEEISSLRVRNDDLSDDVSDLRSEIDKLNRIIDELKDENFELTGEIAELKLYKDKIIIKMNTDRLNKPKKKRGINRELDLT